MLFEKLLLQNGNRGTILKPNINQNTIAVRKKMFKTDYKTRYPKNLTPVCPLTISPGLQPVVGKNNNAVTPYLIIFSRLKSFPPSPPRRLPAQAGRLGAVRFYYLYTDLYRTRANDVCGLRLRGIRYG